MPIIYLLLLVQPTSTHRKYTWPSRQKIGIVTWWVSGMCPQGCSLLLLFFFPQMKSHCFWKEAFLQLQHFRKGWCRVFIYYCLRNQAWSVPAHARTHSSTPCPWIYQSYFDCQYMNPETWSAAPVYTNMLSLLLEFKLNQQSNSVTNLFYH